MHTKNHNDMNATNHCVTHDFSAGCISLKIRFNRPDPEVWMNATEITAKVTEKQRTPADT